LLLIQDLMMGVMTNPARNKLMAQALS